MKRRIQRAMARRRARLPSLPAGLALGGDFIHTDEAEAMSPESVERTLVLVRKYIEESPKQLYPFTPMPPHHMPGTPWR
jgi:hypothetical protein